MGLTPDAGEAAARKGKEFIDALNKKAGKRVIRFQFRVPLDKIRRWIKWLWTSRQR